MTMLSNSFSKQIYFVWCKFFFDASPFHFKIGNRINPAVVAAFFLGPSAQK